MSKIFLRALWLSIVIIPVISSGQTSLEDRLKFEAFINNHEFSNRKPIVKSELKKLPREERPDFAYEQDYLRTLDPATGKPEYDRLTPLFQQTAQPKALVPGIPGSTSFPWVERGPNNVGGRTRALVWDPNATSGNKVWAGGVTGGLWFNNDITSAASQWQPVNDFWDNIAVTCIAFDPNNSQILYVGTGESFTGASRGAGIWKSTDGGVNWSQLSSTSTFFYVNDIVVRNESGTSTVYAAVDGRFYLGAFHGSAQAGLQRSTNGGNTWTQVLPDIGTSNINYVAADIELGADNRIWIGTDPSPFAGTDRGGGRILFSDNGTTWTTSHSVSVANGNGRVELACAPSNANVVYGLVENNRQLEAVVRTTNKGTSWSNMNEPNDDDNGISATDFTRGQATYDLIAAVDPNNANNIIIGGINLHRSTNGGTSWNQISKWSNNPGMFGQPYSLVHADQHAITYKPGNSNTVIFGNDGGVYYTNSVSTAASSDVIAGRKSGYNVTQYYACAINPSASSDNFIAGSQDNGTQEYNTAGMNSTTEKTGGDGAFCFIDQNESNIKITSYVYNNYYLFDGNIYRGQIISNDNNGSFINVADYDDNQNVLYTYKSSNELYRVRNISASSIGNLDSIGINFFSGVTAIKVSPYTTTSTKLFVGTSSGRLFRITNANTNAFASVDISNNSFPNGSISSIEFGANENIMLVTISNYGVNSVWYTTNGGVSWTSKEGNLPDMPVRWGMINPNNANEVIVATEVGIWSTSNLNGNNPTWVSSNSGLANVRVDMLQIRASDNEVIAATHGRGLFSSNAFNNTSGLSISSAVVQPNCGGSNGSITINATGGTTPYSYSWSTGDTNSSISSLSAGTYSVTVTDSAGLVDSLTEFLNSSLSISNFPYSEGFESSFGLFYNDTVNDNIDWEFDFNGTPSGGTGPTAPSQGGFYIRIEGSAPPVGLASPGDEAILVGPCVDLSGASNPFISFDNHQWSQTGTTPANCKLILEADSGNGIWFQLFKQSGDQGNQWNSDTVDLSSFIGNNLTFRFIAKVSDTTGASNFRSDISLDRVYLEKSPPLRISSASVVQSNCGGNGFGSIQVNTTGGQGTVSYSWSNNQTSNSINNLTAGVYTVTATAGSDSDSARFEIFPNNSVSSFPYSESFEKTFGSWSNSLTHQTDWFFDSLKSGSTPGTGPSNASNGNYFLRIESSLPPLGTANAGDSAMLISGCLDLTGATGAYFAFDNHQWSQQGFNQGNPIMRVQVDSSNSGNWQTLFIQQGNQGNQWNSDTVSLLAYHNKQIRIRFNITTGTTLPQNSDLGLDNIFITKFDPLILNSVAKIDPPNCSSANGSATLFVSGGQLPYSFIWANGDTINSRTGLTAGNYGVTISDGFGQIIDTTIRIGGGLVTNYPYNYDWENGIGDWMQEPLNDDFDWTVNSGGTPSGNTGPFGANTGNNYIYTEASTPRANGDSAIIYSPCFDLSNLPAPHFNFDYHMRGNSDFTLQVFADSGDGIWNQLFNNTGGIGNQWNIDSLGLYYYKEKVTRFKIKGTLLAGTGNIWQGDIAIDKVSVDPGVPLQITSLSTNNATCQGLNNGTIQVTAVGGYRPYTYSFDTITSTSNSVSNLSAGSVLVSVFDKYGRTVDTTVTIGEDIVINIATTVTDESCGNAGNGSIVASASGSPFANYSYNWSNNITGPTNNNLSANTYTVSVTDLLGCFALKTDTVGSAAPFQILISRKNEKCDGLNDGSATAQIIGTTSNANYNWSNNDTTPTISNLSPGKYVVSVTDNSTCLVIDSVEILPAPSFGISLSATNVSCKGDSSGTVNLSIQGGLSPFNISWSNGQTDSLSIKNLPSNLYSVIVIDDSLCSQSDFIQVTEPVLPLVILDSIVNETCFGAGDGGAAVQPSGGIPPYQYAWPSPIPSGQQFALGLSSGPVTVTVTDSAGCVKPVPLVIGGPPQIVINFDSVPDLCTTSPIVNLNATPSGGIFSGPGVTGASFNPANAGIGSINLKYNFTNTSGCSDSASQIVKIDSAIVVSQTPIAPICQNANTITLSGGLPSGGNYFINGVASAVFNPSNFNPGSYNVKYEVTTGCGIDSAVSAAQVLNTPTVNAGIDQIIAAGTSAQLNGSVSAFSMANVGAIWQPDTLVQNPFLLNSNTINLAQTSGLVLFAADTLTGCFATDTVLISVTTTPLTVNVIAGQDSVCEGVSVVLSATANGGTGNYSYNWSPINLVSPSNVSNPSALVNNSGYFKVEVTDGFSSATDSVFITSLPKPISTLSIATTYCETDSGIALSGGSPSGGLYLVNGIFSSTFSPINFGVSQQTLGYQVTNSFGCTTTAQQLVDIISSPSASLSGFLPICSNSNPITLTGGSPIGGTYKGNGVSNGLFDPTQVSIGNQAIKYVYTAGSCSDSATQNILVEQAPSIFAGNDTAITSGGTITFNTIASGNNLSYSWSPAAQLVSSNIANPTTVALTNTALFNVTVVDGVNNCSANDDILVSVVGGPLSVNVTASATIICFGDSVTLNALPSGGTGSYTYQWSNSTKLNNANILNPIATIDSSTQFFVTVSDGVNNAISSIAINVNPLPNVSLPAFADVCEGDSPFVLTSGTPNGGSFVGAGINSNVFDPAAAGVGVHPIVYSFTDANGCSNSASSSIQVNGNPLLSTSNSANICDNQSAIGLNIVSPSGGSYSGLGITNGVFDPSIGAGNYAFTYNYVDTNMCSASLIDTLEVNASPVIDAGINQVINTGFNTQFFASVTSPATGFVSSWSPTNFVVSPNSLTSQVAGITVPTLYTLTVTDTNSGCVSTDQMSISVIGGPLFVSLNVDNDTICEGDTVNFNSLSGGGTGIYSYSWNTIALSNDTIGNPFATPSISTTYIVTLDDTVNSVSDTINVVVLAKPQTQFSLPASICSADNPILLNQGLPAGGAYFGNGVSGNFFDPVLAGNGNSKVYYLLTTPNGCSSLDSSAITVNPSPANVSLSLVTSETCKDGNSFLLSGGAPSGGSYSWLGNQNNLFNPFGLSAGSYSVSYQVTNGFGCSASAIDSVNVLPTPTISLISSTNVTCNGNADGEISIAISGGTLPYKTIIWSTGAQSVTTLSSLAANNYSVFVGDSFSCSVSQSYQITEPNQILLNTSTNDIFCNGDNNGVASVLVTGGNSPISFAWSNNKIGPQIDSLASGFYTVSATDAKGCLDSATVQIFEPNMLTGFLNSFPVSCFGKNDGSAQISVIGGTTPYNYLWESGAQTNNATKLSGGYQNITVTDTNNCSFIDSVLVQEPPKINIGIFAIGNTSFCAGGSVFLNANPTNYPTYQWKLNGVNISSATAPVINASLPGNYSVSATDSVGCSATSTVTQVTVAPQPQIVFTGVAGDYCENGDTVLIFASPSGGNFNGPAVSNNVFIPNQLNTGTYQLKYTVTDTNGCTDSANKRVDIRPAPQIGGLLGPTMVQPGNSYTYAINATNGSQYFWSATNGVIGSTTNNLSNITWGTAGTGEIQVVESNFFGCLDTAKFFISIGIQIGTEEFVKTSEVKVYPNPAEDQINLVFETIKSNNGIVNVYANNGRLVFNKTINASQLINGYSLDVSTWSSGIYLITLQSDDIIHKIPLVIR